MGKRQAALLGGRYRGVGRHRGVGRRLRGRVLILGRRRHRRLLELGGGFPLGELAYRGRLLRELCQEASPREPCRAGDLG